jgi:integrase/recombinase XerD
MKTQINAFLDSLDQAQNDYSESTRMAYASDLRVFSNFLENSLMRSPGLEDLNLDRVLDFLDSERHSGLKQSTLIRRRATLRRFTSFLHEAGLIDNNFLAEDSDPINEMISSVPASKSAPCLTDSQVKQLATLIAGSNRPRARRDQAILKLLLETGLSVGTLVDLNLSDLDLNNGRLHLTLENGEDLWLSLGDATEALENYLHQGRADLNHEPNEPALFISQMNGRMSRQGIWQILRYWGRKIAPPMTLSPRLVRHTAVVRMVQAGRAIDEIQALLGHTNPLSTQALLRRLELASGDGI